MLVDSLLERFTNQAPVAVMVRAMLANVLSQAELDRMFRETAEQQVEKDLLFSSVVELLHLVVTKAQPSLHAAYQQRLEELGVSVAALYDKLHGVETPVTRELVRRTAAKMEAIVAQLDPEAASPLPGYEVRILDGFHLAATEHRVKETRRLKGGPLPGQALVVLDPQRKLILDALPWEDGHDQERAILAELVDEPAPGEVWVCDRNFCTAMWLFELDLEGASFVIRQHANLPVETTGQRQASGRTETGQLFEQPATAQDGQGNELPVRRIVVQLHTPTEAGDRELAILTNLPAEIAAAQVAELYRQRWSIEAAFGELTLSLRGEINTLAYPKAALLGFALAAVTYNVLSVVKAAIGATHPGRQSENLSTYYLANEVATAWQGLEIAVDESEWEARYGRLSPAAMARQLKSIAAHVQLRRYQKHPRGPKKKPPKRNGASPHVSTARILEKRK